MKLPTIFEHRRLPSPGVTPQALAWDGKRGVLWMGSRDLRRVYAIDPAEWKVTEDIESLSFNTAISQMMIFVNAFTSLNNLTSSAMAIPPVSPQDRPRGVHFAQSTGFNVKC